MRHRGGVDGRAHHCATFNWRDLGHPEGGGSEIYLHEVATRLAGQGFAITWVTARYPGAPARETIDGIRYVRRGGHLTVYLWAAWLLIARRLGRVDSVLEVQNGMPFLCRLFTRARVVVLVHHVHREQWHVVGPWLARIGWFLESVVSVRVNRGNRYVAVSQRTRSELAALGVDAAAIDVAHNGLPPVPAYVARPRSAEPSIVVLSRLVPHKQIDHLIAMVPRLRQRFPGLTLRIMGAGWWEPNLRAQVTELGLANAVIFLGHVSDESKYAELSAAWIHAQPSVKEGWGLSIVEAARAGTPSIAYRSAGGVCESILEDVTGVLCADRADFERQLELLLADPDRLAAMGAKAELRSHQFDWDEATDRISTALVERDRRLFS